MTKTTGKEIKTIGKKVEYPIYLADEVRNKFINLDLSKYDIKGKSTLILTYCKMVSYRLPKRESISIDMERIANDIGSTRQYISGCIDILMKEGFLISTKNGTVGSSSTYSFPLEPSKGYSCMKFSDYNNKKEEDVKLVNNLNKLSPGAKALYCIMKNQKDFSILSARTGEKYLGVSSHATILRYLKELEESGMIFSDNQKRYFPQEFEYEINNIKVNVSKENNLGSDAKYKIRSLEDEVSRLEQEVSRLSSKLREEDKKVICKGRTKVQLETYINMLEENNQQLQTENSLLKQQCTDYYNRLNGIDKCESNMENTETNAAVEVTYDENNW